MFYNHSYCCICSLIQYSHVYEIVGPVWVLSYKMFYFSSNLIVLVVFVLLVVQDGHGEVWATSCTGMYLVIPFGLRSSAGRAGSGNRGVTENVPKLEIHEDKHTS